MVRLLALLSLVLWASAGTAQDDVEPGVLDQWNADKTLSFDAISADINDFVWVARPVVVFADSPNDPRFIQQMELLRDRADDLAERDVVILTDTDPDAQSALRMRLRPRGFMLVIIGKDGEVELRKPAPWTVREITRSIDKMPLRQQEIEDRRAEP
ncbi:DUF4174 domain-containing protein [Octadecabacter sp. 1_MG-2023]|uniref:DUF4174 domain-containing protein n=1 Tax=unclassified Octadecabacter TaxID=196158 RepID=UPI001C08D03A|nr:MULTISPECIES: DUF4174 domain-containing protein [unclassified Octadecabacter]MBU2993908.1 DUF4174 domain-containing protein [Octadecabacter sp. B2R22]MDO6735246.1 DUF4174 domain-containing protein [Octadecabacter sp. 1_MG-2023]